MTPRPCALSIDFDTLSAWRSQLLPADTMRHLDAHVPTCAACQAQATAIMRMGDMLRAQRVPPTDDRVWRGVHAGMRQERITMRTVPKPVALAGLGGAGVIVILFAVLLLSLGSNGPAHPISVVPSVSPSATTFVKVTPTDGPAYVPDTNGWHTVASLNYGKWIAFAPGDGQTGYVCGNTATGGATAPIQVGVTHDGGATWNVAATLPFTQVGCHIDINPYHPQDVVVEGAQTWCNICPNTFIDLYRSLDGGVTWNPITLPPGKEQIIAKPKLDAPIWTPTAMYITIAGNLGSGANTSSQLGHIVATSVNGAAPTWTANPFASDAYFQQEFEFWGISYPFADGANYGFAVRNEQVPGYSYMVTSDGGATWKEIMSNNADIMVIQTTYSARGLLAYGTVAPGNRATMYVSSVAALDTWTALPNLPSATFGYNNSFVAPDGTVFVAGSDSYTNAAYHVLALAPASATWDQVATYVFQQFPVAVSTDPNGKPTKLWSIRVYDNRGNPQPNPPPQIQYLTLP